MSERLHWLHGWPRMGQFDALVGVGLHCVGCGRDHGVTCVVFDESSLPDRVPDWPFPEGECPVCDANELAATQERLSRYAAGPVHKLP